MKGIMEAWMEKKNFNNIGGNLTGTSTTQKG